MSTKYKAGGVTVTIGQSQDVTLPTRVFRGRATCMHFDTDKSFLLPPSVTGVRNIVSFFNRHAGTNMLVNGHTDLVGDAQYNLQLSNERAAAVAAYLIDKVDDWLAWYHSPIASKRWSTLEDQYMLQTITDSTGKPYYGGSATGSADAATQDALKRFQTDNGLASDGVAGDDTRRALIGKYMALEGTSLPASTSLAQHGCGKFHPIDPTTQADQGNRRVEIFLFDGPIDPPPQSTCPSPGCLEYPKWVGNPDEDVDLCQAQTDTLRVRLFDMYQQPLANAACKIFVGGSQVFAGNADASGFIHVGDVQLPDTCQIKWTTATTMPSSDDLLLYSLDAFVNLDGKSDEDAVKLRLSNLGYRFGDTLADDIKAFQHDRGLAETGQVADVKDQVIEVHDNFEPGPPPQLPPPFTMTSSHEP